MAPEALPIKYVGGSQIRTWVSRSHKAARDVGDLVVVDASDLADLVILVALTDLAALGLRERGVEEAVCRGS